MDIPLIPTLSNWVLQVSLVLRDLGAGPSLGLTNSRHHLSAHSFVRGWPFSTEVNECSMPPFPGLATTARPRAPRETLRLRSGQALGHPIPNLQLAIQSFEPRPRKMIFLSCWWIDLHHQDICIVNPYRAWLPEAIPAETAPGPLFGGLDQSSFDWVAVDVAQLFDSFVLAPDVEIVEAGLPEVVGSPTHVSQRRREMGHPMHFIRLARPGYQILTRAI